MIITSRWGAHGAFHVRRRFTNNPKVSTERELRPDAAQLEYSTEAKPATEQHAA